MILPTISALISREVFLQVPARPRRGRPRPRRDPLGDGPDRRSSRSPSPGMISAAMLGLGRALGETIAVALVLSAVVRDQLAHHRARRQHLRRQHRAEVERGRHRRAVGALIASGLVLFVDHPRRQHGRPAGHRAAPPSSPERTDERTHHRAPPARRTRCGRTARSTGGRLPRWATGAARRRSRRSAWRCCSPRRPRCPGVAGTLDRRGPAVPGAADAVELPGRGPTARRGPARDHRWSTRRSSSRSSRSWRSVHGGQQGPQRAERRRSSRTRCATSSPSADGGGHLPRLDRHAAAGRHRRPDRRPDRASSSRSTWSSTARPAARLPRGDQLLRRRDDRRAVGRGRAVRLHRAAC